MIHVTELRKTCRACTAQWEGTDADGKKVHVRYRAGFLVVVVGSQAIVCEQVGDGLDGAMDLNELRDHTAGLVFGT